MSVERMKIYMISICLCVAALGAFLEWFYIILRCEVSKDDEVQRSYKGLVSYCHRFSVAVPFFIWIISNESMNKKIGDFYFCLIIIWGAALLGSVICFVVEKICKHPVGSGISAVGVAEVGRRCLVRGFAAFLMWWLVV